MISDLQKLGGISALLEAAVRLIGPLALRVRPLSGHVVGAGPFEIGRNYTLPPGGTEFITILFRPRNAGNFSETIGFHLGDATVNVVMNGTGYEASKKTRVNQPTGSK